LSTLEPVDGKPVPDLVAIRLQIDTGANLTGFLPSVFEQLGIGPYRMTPVSTPSTKKGTPFRVPQYDVSLFLLANARLTEFGSVRAIAAEDFSEVGKGVQGILRTDILDRCHLQYFGPERNFTLAW
jgi:hypothetical protein